MKCIKGYSTTQCNSCRWIISYSKHHLESPNQNNLVKFWELQAHKCLEYTKFNNLFLFRSFKIIQKRKKGERRWINKVTGKTIPFLCLPFPHLQLFCTMETGERADSQPLLKLFTQSGFPKSFAISVHRWHSTLLTSSSFLNNKLQFLMKMRGDITHTKQFFYMTQRPKKPQVFHYLNYWLHFIGHGSTITK